MVRTTSMDSSIFLALFASILYTILAQNVSTTTGVATTTTFGKAAQNQTTTTVTTTSTETVFTTSPMAATTDTVSTTMVTTTVTTASSMVTAVATMTSSPLSLIPSTTNLTGFNATVTTHPLAPCNTIIQGNLFLDVNDPALFVQDAKSALAVARGIAAELEVDASNVHVVLSLNTRRLTSSSLRGAQFSGSVMVSYTITVPPTEHLADDHSAVAAISQKMTAVVNDPAVKHSFGRNINQQFQAGDYSVAITAAIAPTLESQVITTTITTTAATPITTKMPIEPGDDSSFAHKHEALGAAHVFGMMMILMAC